MSFDKERDNKSPKFNKKFDDKKFSDRKEKDLSMHGTVPHKKEAKFERVAKVMARAGVCSRREAERMIEEGRVSVNGRLLSTPAVKVSAQDVIKVDGKKIQAAEATRLWKYYKPAGLVTSHNDPEGRPTVFSRIRQEGLPRVVSVGRLDINTEGLLLVTNNGALARHLELPTTGWQRKYRARAYGKVEQADLDKLKDGIEVDGIRYGSVLATLERQSGDNCWISLSLKEGKNREVKEVLGALGLQVNRLIRISYGPFKLDNMERGQVEPVTTKMLKEQLGKAFDMIDEGYDETLRPQDQTSKLDGDSRSRNFDRRDRRQNDDRRSDRGSRSFDKDRKGRRDDNRGERKYNRDGDFKKREGDFKKRDGDKFEKRPGRNNERPSNRRFDKKDGERKEGRFEGSKGGHRERPRGGKNRDGFAGRRRGGSNHRGQSGGKGGFKGGSKRD